MMFINKASHHIRIYSMIVCGCAKDSGRPNYVADFFFVQLGCNHSKSQEMDDP